MMHQKEIGNEGFAYFAIVNVPAKIFQQETTITE